MVADIMMICQVQQATDEKVYHIDKGKKNGHF